MEFITDYFKVIDILALVALVVMACAAFYRRENLWLWLLGIVVVIWATNRVLGIL